MLSNGQPTWNLGKEGYQGIIEQEAGENDTNINFVLDFVLRKALEIWVLLENSIYILLVYQLNEIHCLILYSL